MKQFFILGASSVYGVGAKQGWGDKIKDYIHSKIYDVNGSGENHEVFNFAKSGSTVEFVASTYGWILENYKRTNAETFAIISLGGNDARAIDSPTNYICSTEDFRGKVSMLLTEMRERFDHVVFVSNGFVDESKVSPKPSLSREGKSTYFTNERRELFNNISKAICSNLGIDYVSLPIDKDEWVKTCLCSDGLHPNQHGYDMVFDNIKPILEKYV